MRRRRTDAFELVWKSWESNYFVPRFVSSTNIVAVTEEISMSNASR